MQSRKLHDEKKIEEGQMIEINELLDKLKQPRIEPFKK